MGSRIQRYDGPQSTVGRKLEWQSWLVVAAVAPWCAIAALRYAVTAWSEVTRTALGISLVLALLVWLGRAATPMAALTGGLLTAVLTLAFGGSEAWYHSALPPLLLLFLLTFSATRFGRGRKQQLGVAEDKRGRNAAQVAANLGAAGLAAAAALNHRNYPNYPNYPSADAFYAVLVVAALAEATADTLASELGEVLGGSPFLITSRRRVPPGTDGAVSLAGTAAGVAGAALVVLAAIPALQLNLAHALSAYLGAIAGLFVDSLLGATVERRGWLNNDAVNFLSTLAASLFAAALSLMH